jgi:hypothetical protein
MSLSATYQDGKIDVKMDDQQTTIDYQGALLCDGPGLDAILQALPLAEGYQLGVNVADLTSMKAETMVLKVVGSDTVEGQKLLKVTLIGVENPAQKTTFWLDPQTKATVKSEQVLPQMGNAVLTKSLVK